MTLLDIREKLEKAWSKETSYSPELFEVEDKATGQCCVTALAIETYFGGWVMSGIVKYNGFKVRHYWNRINDLDIDLTWRQFPAGAKLTNIKKSNTFVLRRNKNLMERYFKLVNKKNGF